MKKYFSKGFLVLGFLALSTSMFAATSTLVTIDCGDGLTGSYYSSQKNAADLAAEAMAVADEFCD
jgi:hypothetical protein